MTPDDLIRYLSAYGELEGHTLQQFTLPGYPQIFLLSNIEKDGKPIGAHNDGVGWHTDYSYKEFPVKCTMLYAVMVPDEGSDTWIADCCAAYDALPQERKEEIEDLKLHHSYKFFMETREHGRMKLSPELERENPDVIHPLVRRHPANGRKALWPSTGTVKEICGMSILSGTWHQLRLNSLTIFALRYESSRYVPFLPLCIAVFFVATPNQIKL